MYYIKKGKKVVATSNPDDVTVENFVADPRGKNRVWFKLEQYEFDRETGEKRTIYNQVMGENPKDFEMMAPVWKRQGMKITILKDPRGGVKSSVAKKLAILNENLNLNLNLDVDKDVDGDDVKKSNK